ncbi:hypothetical protein GCM10007205_10700 [Oxalicibacterium flavum]|uniref:AlgX/AlgJ SGNH hydrolase-like domain-containing protein n=1 Tax=Oxalicibacterium flavum TaxID=179467 RepID=A0A8J2XYY1_9BURK|nr:hypothetical protein GCM10007205_10700 [Oxalicibacterium flavum]
MTVSQALNSSLRLPMQDSINTWNAAWRYRFLGDLGSKVRLGCPQWLFYQDGLQPAAGSVLAERLQLMRIWISQIRQQGVQILVVAVPDKSRVESAHLCGLSVSESMRQKLDEWQAELKKDGVPFADLRPAMLQANEPLFFRTDAHMNAVGARIAAASVAEEALVLLKGRSNQLFKFEEAEPLRPRMGDLIVLAGLENAPEKWRPKLDVVSEQPISVVRGGGLLDDGPAAEVLLAGSSNGRRSYFAEHLGMALGREVWNISMDGGQFSGALQEALKQKSSWPSTLKLVIWEFSELALSLPLTEAERAALAARQ